MSNLHFFVNSCRAFEMFENKTKQINIWAIFISGQNIFYIRHTDSRWNQNSNKYFYFLKDIAECCFYSQRDFLLNVIVHWHCFSTSVSNPPLDHTEWRGLALQQTECRGLALQQTEWRGLALLQYEWRKKERTTLQQSDWRGLVLLQSDWRKKRKDSTPAIGVAYTSNQTLQQSEWRRIEIQHSSNLSGIEKQEQQELYGFERPIVTEGMVCLLEDVSIICHNIWERERKDFQYRAQRPAEQFVVCQTNAIQLHTYPNGCSDNFVGSLSLTLEWFTAINCHSLTTIKDRDLVSTYQ